MDVDGFVEYWKNLFGPLGSIHNIYPLPATKNPDCRLKAHSNMT